MWINGKWYTEPQIQCYITELKEKVTDSRRNAIMEFCSELMYNLNETISDYSNAGRGLNIYAWLLSYIEDIKDCFARKGEKDE